VEPTKLDQLYFLGPADQVPPEDGDRVQSPKVMFEIKDKAVDNVQNCDRIYLP
jgi:hypothetical protein